MNKNFKLLYYRIKNCYQTLKYYLFKYKRPNLYSLIKKNENYKNIHNGKRCFIIGNGPSLNSQDLSQLSEEYVFTVNQVMRHPNFEKIRTNYHFWADPSFFNIDESKKEDIELLKIMKSVNSEKNRPVCFFPIDQVSFIKKFNLEESMNVNYFMSQYIFHDNYNRKIDFSKAIPSFGTVIHWAIIAAIYMGFKEIYLLGCDTTGIITTVNSALKESTDGCYAYQVSENEKKRMENLLKNQSLEEYTRSYADTLSGYRRLFEYCTIRGIKLVNCSEKTVVESIPRMNLNKILKK